jgi:glyoxylase-like metal-dependent hydrolase (beta-lactamase superfamily II)
MESGVAQMLEPGVRMVLAPNPSPMTFRGTNTYLVGRGAVAVIDPGPDDSGHLAAILNALAPGERVARILITHSHLDHSALARRLSDATGAPVLAAGPSDWGRRPIMQTLARTGALGGGEGVDHAFRPDVQVAQGDVIDGDFGRIEVLETPGHMANHLSFAWKDMLFSGDLVMGWSTSLVSPPDGDMTAFMASLAVLAARADRVYYPGHGDPVTRPQSRCSALVAHRLSREAQIRAALQDLGQGTAADIARAVYHDLQPALVPAAERNVLAHLIDLNEKKIVALEGALSVGAAFRLT